MRQGMTCLQGHDFPSIETSRHCCLVFRSNHSVFACYLIPGRLLPPGWSGDDVAKGACKRRFLGGRQNESIFEGYILAEAFVKFVGLES